MNTYIVIIVVANLILLDQTPTVLFRDGRSIFQVYLPRNSNISITLPQARIKTVVSDLSTEIAFDYHYR